MGSGKELGAMADKLTLRAERVPIDAACALAQGYIKWKGGSQDDADRAALNLARFIAMRTNGHAAAFLNHFLDGSGTDLYFDLGEMLDENPSVYGRLEYEILRKLSGVKVGKDENNSRISLDPCVTIFQRTYDDQDWWYALGTFNIDWEGLQSTATHHFIRVGGVNEYKWHPEEKRITQCLHAAGDRLNITGKGGKNFRIVAQPRILVFSEQRRKIIGLVSLSSYKPAGNSGGISLSGLTGRNISVK